MIKLDLTILMVDSIPARIYLASLLKKGYVPNVLYCDLLPTSNKVVYVKKYFGDYLTRMMYKIYCKVVRKNNISEFSEVILADYGLSSKDVKSCVKEAKKRKDIDFKIIKVNGLDDNALCEHLKSNKGTYLFTGGGILKKPILSINGVKFIHIHPGLVPEVRGADCFFWSYLIKGKLGYSTFYMDEGIDAGDVLHRKEYDFKLPKYDIENLKSDEIYSDILKCYDPCLRILSFLELLQIIFDREECYESDDVLSFIGLNGEKQMKETGRYYFFMHRKVRNLVIKKLVKG